MIDLREEDTGSSFQDAMTPMIDVIFVLIAFMMLMINVPILTMKVELPKVAEAPRPANVQKQVVTIGLSDHDDGWLVNESSVHSIDALKTFLEEEKKEFPERLSVVIYSDKKVPMERVVKLFAALQSLDLNVSHLALQE